MLKSELPEGPVSANLNLRKVRFMSNLGLLRHCEQLVNIYRCPCALIVTYSTFICFDACDLEAELFQFHQCFASTLKT